MTYRLRLFARALIEQAGMLWVHSRLTGVTMGFALATVLLMGASAEAQCLTPDSLIEVNRRLVRIEGATSLMDIVNRVVSARRLGINAVRPGDQPLVVIDGVQHPGEARWLAEVPLNEVQTVTTLRPVDAVARYGGVAVLGAIVVETRLGRATRGPSGLPDCSVKREP